MKHVSNNACKIVIEWLLLLVMFLSHLVGSSSLINNKPWSESEIVTRYMYQTHSQNVIMVSKSKNYPNFSNEARNYLGYEIIRAYANNQESFVCSISDTERDPFVLKELSLSVPFICLNGYGGNKESYVTRYCSLMFGNEIKSASLGTDNIYISSSVANKILHIDSPTSDDYKSLISSKIAFLVTKNGITKEQEFTIVDITTSFTKKWMEPLYGSDLIFGGFYCAEKAILDNLSVHTVLENDIYSNAYFFSKAKYLLTQKCNYDCEYSVINNKQMRPNTTLNNKVKSNNSTIATVLRIVSGLLLLSLSFFLFTRFLMSLFKRKSYLLKMFWGPFIVALTFSSSIFIGTIATIWLPLSFSVFSPIGFIFETILFVAIIFLSYFINKKNKKFLAEELEIEI